MNLEEILLLHQIMIQRTGGAPGVRDSGLIESALHRASASFDNVEIYSNPLSKAAATGCGLI